MIASLSFPQFMRSNPNLPAKYKVEAHVFRQNIKYMSGTRFLAEDVVEIYFSGACVF